MLPNKLRTLGDDPWFIQYFKKAVCVLCLLVFSNGTIHAQIDTLNKKRLAIICISSGVGYAGMLIGLNQAWYANYPRSGFHYINDNGEWLQMDKAGHITSSYAYGLAGIEMMKWTGMPRKKAIWIGGLAGTIFQTPIEILDGFSEQWGASTGDLLANTIGSALLISQELAWDEQRIQLKFSYWPSDYASRRPNLLGENAVSRVLKDYNAHTYWLSVNPWSFAKKSGWPNWLNISLGYGASGMLGGYTNIWTDKDQQIHDYSSITRQRQYYLSFDVDLQHIPVKNIFLKRILRLANMIKIPAPALVYNQNGKWQFYPLYF